MMTAEPTTTTITAEKTTTTAKLWAMVRQKSQQPLHEGFALIERKTPKPPLQHFINLFATHCHF
jgi:hypothetical protein